MRFCFTLFIRLGLVLLVSSSALARTAVDPVDDVFQRGIDAYRGGAYGEAESIWTSLYAMDGLSDRARAKLAFNLGNVAYRDERTNEAVGWYTLATKLAPRDEFARRNLEFVRGKAGWSPDDRGDLSSTFRRLVTVLTANERRNLLALALGVLVLVAGAEILFGGRAWRRLLVLALVFLALAAVPWFFGLTGRADDPFLVVADARAKLRSEPSMDKATTAELTPGEVVERLDELDGWTRVEASGDRRGWVHSDELFSLER